MKNLPRFMDQIAGSYTPSNRRCLLTIRPTVKSLGEDTVDWALFSAFVSLFDIDGSDPLDLQQVRQSVKDCLGLLDKTKLLYYNLDVTHDI